MALWSVPAIAVAAPDLRDEIAFRRDMAIDSVLIVDSRSSNFTQI